jgi:hypothetical protein
MTLWQAGAKPLRRLRLWQRSTYTQHAHCAGTIPAASEAAARLDIPPLLTVHTGCESRLSVVASLCC